MATHELTRFAQFHSNSIPEIHSVEFSGAAKGVWGAQTLHIATIDVKKIAQDCSKKRKIKVMFDI